MISSPLLGKAGVYMNTLDAGLHLPLSNFQEEVLQKRGCSIQMLTSSTVNKFVAFEMIYRANGVTPGSWYAFKLIQVSFWKGNSTSWWPQTR